MAKGTKVISKGGSGAWGFTLFLSWVGAVVYFVQQNDGFGGFIVAILQACVWPAYIVFHVLTLLHA